MYPCLTGPSLPLLPFYLLLYVPLKTISFNHHLCPFLSLPLCRKPYPFHFPPTPVLPTYIFLLSQTHIHTHTHSFFSASHSSPGVFFGDQSSSSLCCHTVGSKQNAGTNAYTNIYDNEWATNANFFVKLGSSRSQRKYTCLDANGHNCTLCPYACVCSSSPCCWL